MRTVRWGARGSCRARSAEARYPYRTGHRRAGSWCAIGLVRAHAQQHKRKYKRWQREAPMQLWQMDIVGGVFCRRPRMQDRHRYRRPLPLHRDRPRRCRSHRARGRGGFRRRHQLRQVAADSDIAEAVKVAARAHQTLIWERTRHLLGCAPRCGNISPVHWRPRAARPGRRRHCRAAHPRTRSGSAARLTVEQIAAALKRARRHDTAAKVAAIAATLATPQLSQATVVAAAYAASVRATVAILTILNEQIKLMEIEVKAHFGRHPDAEIYLSLPSMGPITGARVLAEFGDAPQRYADAKSRKNYAGTSPITRQSDKTKTVHARFIHNDRLVDALHLQAGAAILHDPSCRAYYDELRTREVEHSAALRQLGNRPVGVLHGCLKTRTHYDQATAWSHRYQHIAA